MRSPYSLARQLAVVAFCVVSAGSGAAQGPSTIVAAGAAATLGTGRPAAVTVTRRSLADLRVVDQAIDGMIRDRSLVVREVQSDALLPDRTHQRLDQYLRGVRIVGGDLTRQTASDGTVSVFGTLHTDLALDLIPTLSTDEARAAIARGSGGESTGTAAELVVFPLADGYHLAYRGQALIGGIEIVDVYVDAGNGAVLQQYSEFINEVGRGVGIYGDQKKVSAKASSGTFVADDPLRPAAVTTYDMKGNLARTVSALNRITPLSSSDIASDSDNDWTDGAVVDAHVYGGWYYDFLFKRFGRHGLDDRDLRMPMITHPVRGQDILTASDAVIGQYYLNAFFCPTCLSDGRGAMVFGEGAPRGTLSPTIEVKPFSAALDVVGHELTHGVTSNSARLNGFPYSDAGALNEAFSDMIGVATAFYYQSPGNAAMQASYVVGKDLSVPSGAFAIRNIANPRVNGDPDHYSMRFLGGDPHYNSTIASHAYYLAIEGGTNRTSGRTVQGVGAANREQIEKTFFRALTVLMPSSSTFGLTRVATIQAARDLYGPNSTVERAVTEAWDAVGVQERTVPTAALLPDPAAPTAAFCSGGTTPNWVVGVTVSAGTSTLRITQWTFDAFDHTGKNVEHDLLGATDFAAFFTSCGAPSTSVPAQTDSCSAICFDLGGDSTGTAQLSFTALDAGGQRVVFSTPRSTLVAR